MTDTATAPVAFPVPEFNDITVVFGAPAKAYLTREQMGDAFYGDRNEFTEHVSSIFFRGGGDPLPAGRRWKPEIDQTKACRAIGALLRSFEPKHEIKIGTVGYALSQWTEAA